MGILKRLSEIFNTSKNQKNGSPIIGGRDYVEIDPNSYEHIEESKNQDILVHVAEPNNQTDIMDIKDLIYDGDIVIIDPFNWEKDQEKLTQELKEAINDIDGDIAMKRNEEFIVVPTGIKISREKIGG